ncbi:MAG TPA: hypothetical protein VLA85_12720, partial [Verrucomicrobiae bacterium]|nr:hypothetical protein [Verrucomicrobiae bacterium]
PAKPGATMSAVVAKAPATMTRSDLPERAMPISLYRGGQARRPARHCFVLSAEIVRRRSRRRRAIGER